MNSLKIQWNHLTHKNIFCSSLYIYLPHTNQTSAWTLRSWPCCVWVSINFKDLIWCVQKLIPTQHRSINQCIAAMFPPILGDYFRIGTSITIWFSSSGSFIGIYNHDSWAVGFLILMCNHSSQISKKWFWSALCFPSPPHFGDVALVANHPKRDLSVGGNNLLESSQNCRKSGRKTWLTSDKLFFGVVIRCWQKI
jgi:hypothetical protein